MPLSQRMNKKLLSIIIFSLLWCNVGFADRMLRLRCNPEDAGQGVFNFLFNLTQNKVVERNEDAYEQISHIAWNIPIPGATHDPYIVGNEFVQKVIEDKMNSSREMINSQELTLIYQND